jgi:hypothetical protein
MRARLASTLPSLLAAVLFASRIPCQVAEAPPATTALPASIQASAHGLAPTAEGLEGFGARYDVRFRADGVTFVPALGRKAPCDQRLQWQLASIRCGEVALPLAANVAPQQRGAQAVYPRSATIEERYDVRPDGVEQSFVFTARPGRGDLVVRCTLAGELAARGEAARDGGLQFLVPELGGATVGAVTGIAADGARCAGAVRLVDGAFELSLPAHFVATAALPLVLDPLFGPRVDLGAGPGHDEAPAVGADVSSADFLVAWIRVTSGTSATAFARHYNGVTGLGPTLSLGSGTVLRSIRVANHNATNRWLVVWENATGALGPSRITSRVVNADRSLGNLLDLTSPTAHCVEPDLAGNPGATVNDLAGMVTYREPGVGIRVLPYTMTFGTLDIVPGTATTIATDLTAVNPRLSQAAWPTRVVCWGHVQGVVLQQVDLAGAPVGSSGQVDVPVPVERCAIDGKDGSFLVVYERQVAVGNRDLLAATVTTTPAGITLASTGTIANQPADELDPAIGLIGAKYLVCFARTTGFLDWQLQVRPMATTGCVFCGPETTLNGALTGERAPAVTSRFANGGSGQGLGMIVYSSSTTSWPLQGDIHAQQFAAASTTTPTLLWNGCGSATTLVADGTFTLGSSGFQFRLQSSDPQAAIGLFSFGFGSGPLACGGCTFVAPNVLVAGLLVAGQLAFPLPIPCDTNLLGVQLDAQGAVLGAVNNLCPLVPEASASAAFRYTLAE